MFLENLNLLKKYFRFRINSKPRGGHGIHSPFVYNLYTQCIDAKNRSDFFQKIEVARRKLLNNKTIITKNDFGAGSKIIKNGKITIGKITKQASASPHMGQLLFRIADYFKPNTIIELGTSLGISTSYLAAGCRNSKVISIEGDETLATKANENITKLGLNNVSIICGDFDTQILAILDNIETIGIVFIDGNHTEEATMRYFKFFSEKASDDTLIIIDDIRWSDEMQRAWRNICDDINVTISIDLFNCGLVFFRKGVAKQHFNLRYGPF
jgi:predicted O-methyltransferase YrrM